MARYQKYVTIADPNHVVLSGLPFAAGQRVKVVLTTEDNQQTVDIEALRTLFKKTQALPQAQAVSVDEIAAEIAAYRSGQ